MAHIMEGKNQRSFLGILILSILLLSVLVLCNIPISRQFVGFVFLTFVPGLTIISILKLDRLDWLEKVLISVGLSIAFLLISGVILNELSMFMGSVSLLQPIPLLIVIMGFVLFGGLVVYKNNKKLVFWAFGDLKSELLNLLPLALIILSVLGTYYVNSYSNNAILLILLILIPLLIAVLALIKRPMPEKFYAVTIFAIALSLLYHVTLISQYVYGSDVHLELAVFKFTEANQSWNTAVSNFGLNFGRFNSMLSITILPTIYSNILNLDPASVFKVLYPFFFAFVPLCLYQIWRKYVGNKFALISAFLFMSLQTFFIEMPGLNRQIVAELFFVLLLLVILNKTIKPFNRALLFVVFSFGLIVSHYGLSEILLFFILVTFVYSYFRKNSNSKITSFSIVSFSVIMFFWYIFTAQSAVFDSILEFGNFVFSQFGDFLNPAARGQMVLLGLGVGTSPTIWNTLSRALAYTIQILIVFGLIALLTKKARFHFDKDYLNLTFIATLFLGALILIPGLANTLNMSRFYHILLFFLAPLCVVGTDAIVKLVFKHKKVLTSVLLVLILVPYFLFQTNFVYEVTDNESYSVPLSKYRMDSVMLYSWAGYLDTESVYSAQWFSLNINSNQTEIFADSTSRYKVLTSYGMIYPSTINILSNTTAELPNNAAVYLSTLNVVYGKIIGENFIWNSTDFSYLFEDTNTVYSNGDSIILVSTSPK